MEIGKKNGHLVPKRPLPGFEERDLRVAGPSLSPLKPPSFCNPYPAGCPYDCIRGVEDRIVKRSRCNIRGSKARPRGFAMASASSPTTLTHLPGLRGACHGQGTQAGQERYGMIEAIGGDNGLRHLQAPVYLYFPPNELEKDNSSERGSSACRSVGRRCSVVSYEGRVKGRASIWSWLGS
ncbi:hypothetical protein VNO77_19390 [Canavalia gladiata]|uniref:Uncharacterized protein n=1 Tax=Canavalia gladiata TaxID=3824 RepID=A0AAN9LMM1_CANGL